MLQERVGNGYLQSPTNDVVLNVQMKDYISQIPEAKVQHVQSGSFFEDHNSPLRRCILILLPKQKGIIRLYTIPNARLMHFFLKTPLSNHHDR
jgi:hypothetical protein